MHVKIVVDVIKDTASTEGGRQGAYYGRDLSKQKVFIGCSSLCAPSGCYTSCRHSGTGKREHTDTYTCSGESNTQLNYSSRITDF